MLRYLRLCVTRSLGVFITLDVTLDVFIVLLHLRWCVCVWVRFVRVCLHVRVLVCIYIHTYNIHVLVYIYTYIIYIHTYIYIHYVCMYVKRLLYCIYIMYVCMSSACYIVYHNAKRGMEKMEMWVGEL